MASFNKKHVTIIRHATENSDKIKTQKSLVGVYSKLTNSYGLVGMGESFNQLHDVFEEVMGDYIPVLRVSVAGCDIVGRLTAGNKNGLLLPSSTTDTELQHIRNSLPDNVRVKCVEERLSALGNVVACNDYVALVHPDLDDETEEIIADTLNVEVYRTTVTGSSLVGSQILFNNRGGVVHEETTELEQEELSTLLRVPVVPVLVNPGSLLPTSIVANDWCMISGNSNTWFGRESAWEALKYREAGKPKRLSALNQTHY